MVFLSASEINFITFLFFIILIAITYIYIRKKNIAYPFPYLLTQAKIIKIK